MTNRTLSVIIFAIAACAPCIGQTEFQGLTPGKSTRVEVERRLGQPVKKATATLSEYAPRQLKLAREKISLNTGKVYVQYRDGSTAALVDRIELILCPRDPAKSVGQSNEQCNVSAMHHEYDPDGVTLDAHLTIPTAGGNKLTWYFGSPRYMVRTGIDKEGTEIRWGFYSKELYESIAPTGNCTGMLRGEWETSRGRTTFARVDDTGQIRGTYSQNNGRFTGTISGGGNVSGNWEDDTGRGTMFLQLPFPGYKKFEGTWQRTTGSGPAKGTWEGHCVETN